MALALSRTKTPISSGHNPVSERLTMITAAISFSGHENSGNLAYVTRINLRWASPDHRFTLLTPVDANGLTNFNSIDGSTWDPFYWNHAFTQEAGANGGVIEMGSILIRIPEQALVCARSMAALAPPGRLRGIHLMTRGNIWIVEDVGGTTVMNNGRNPNSFVYRFVPTALGDLTHGKLQGAPSLDQRNPVVFVPVDAQHPNGDTRSDNQLRLHTVGGVLAGTMVTVHDTQINGADPFDAQRLWQKLLAQHIQASGE